MVVALIAIMGATTLTQNIGLAKFSSSYLYKLVEIPKVFPPKTFQVDDVSSNQLQLVWNIFEVGLWVPTA